MIELTDEQRLLLRSSSEPRARDPHTNETYVLVRSDVYKRLMERLEDDWAGATQLAMEAFAREGWDDPRMDVYDDLDPRKSP